MEIFIQCPTSGLEKILKKNLCWGAIQEILKISIKAIDFLVKKYGFFRITNEMIKVSRSNNLLIWPN